MNFRKTLLKKAMAIVCAGAMTVSSLVTSVGAANTHAAEVQFALKYMDMLPKEGGDFTESLALPDLNSLNENRQLAVMKEDCGNPNSVKKEIVNLPERTKYNEIQGIVNRIKGEIDKGAAGDLSFVFGHNNRDNLDMPRQMRIANAIYHWILTNIGYDFVSENTLIPAGQQWNCQDALAVYFNHTGMCTGISDITKLMMRLAGIPCVAVGSNACEDGGSHSWNAIYLDDSEHGRKGWTFVDSTWGVGGNAAVFFPAFFDTQTSFSELNKGIMEYEAHVPAEICFEMDSKGIYSKRLDFNVDGVQYQLFGTEGNSCVRLTGANGQIKENAVISPDIANLGMSFKIGPWIKTLILKGDEIIDISEACHIQNIDTTQSNKYVWSKEYGPKGGLYTKEQYLYKLKSDLETKGKQFENRVNEHRIFRKPFEGKVFDFTSQYRQNAVDAYNNAFNNLNNVNIGQNIENIKDAIAKIDQAIWQMDQFKLNCMNNNNFNNKFMNNNFMNNNNFNNNFMNNNFMNNNNFNKFMNNNFMNNNFNKFMNNNFMNNNFNKFMNNNFMNNNFNKFMNNNFMNNNFNKFMNNNFMNNNNFNNKFMNNNFMNNNFNKLILNLENKRKQFEQEVGQHRMFRNSLNGNYFDFTLQYRQNAVNFYTIMINNNLTEANMQQAINIFDQAIWQMKKFRWNFMNNNNNFINLGVA